jgi:hypothetical protein
MNPSDVLIVIAEVAVGLAGFSGVVVTLGRRHSAPWRDDERLRFTQLLCVALGCAFFAILPLALMLSPLETETIVQVCGIPAALLFGGIVFTTLIRILQLSGELKARFSIPFTAFVGTGTLIMASLGLLNGAGLLITPSIWIYVLVLVWALVVSGLQFLRIVLVGMAASGD